MILKAFEDVISFCVGSVQCQGPNCSGDRRVFRHWSDDCKGECAWPSLSVTLVKEKQAFVSNGAKVYVTALPTDDIQDVVNELNRIGQPSGGIAVG